MPAYSFTPLSIAGTPEQFYIATDPRVAEVLLRIVEHEAPIHLMEATRRVAAHWQMSRAGSRIRERVESVAAMLHRRGALELDQQFLWKKGQPEIPIRSRAVPGYSFDPEYIAPEEFQAVIVFALRAYGTRMRDELITEAARVLGFDRAGRKLSEQLSAAIQGLVEKSELRAVAAGVQLVAKSDAG